MLGVNEVVCSLPVWRLRIEGLLNEVKKLHDVVSLVYFFPLLVRLESISHVRGTLGKEDREYFFGVLPPQSCLSCILFPFLNVDGHDVWG